MATTTRDGKLTVKWHRSNKELGYPAGWKITEAFETGQPVDVSRNIAIAKALSLRAKFILFWDSDVLVPPDSLQKLLQARVPVVGALLRSRGPPFQFLANVNDQPVPDQILSQEVLMEVDEVAMGFVLIDCRALHRYGRKLDHFQCFKNHRQEIGDPVAKFDYKTTLENDFTCSYCKGILHAKFFDYRAGKTSKMAISEDYFFCRNLKEKTGLKTYVFSGVKAIHENSFGEVYAEKPELITSLGSAANVT